MRDDSIVEGALFKNEKKEAGSKQPDYTGSGELANGNKVQISGWIRKAKESGKKFISLVIKPPFEPTQGSSRGGYKGREDSAPF